MLRYQCDTCKVLKEPHEEWILGIAAENIGAVSARREIAFEPEWNAERAVNPFAVHFCSIECKDDYLRAVFGQDIAQSAGSVVPMPKTASTRSSRAQGRVKRRA